MSARACSAIAALLLCAAAGCATSSPATGTALVPGYKTIFGLAPLKPGTQLGLLDVYLQNRSHSPITIDSVRGMGRGLGTIIKVVEVKIAPARGVDGKAVPDGVGGGAYETDPPVMWTGPGKCNEELLVRLHGFQLAAGGLARVWIVVQAARPGRFAVTGHLVRYTQGGTLYQKLVPEGYHGSISRTARFIPIDWSEARCLKIIKTRVLPGQHVHKPLSATAPTFRLTTPRPLDAHKAVLRDLGARAYGGVAR
jgi:hypothetical protein